jgi:hypothetical protein
MQKHGLGLPAAGMFLVSRNGMSTIGGFRNHLMPLESEAVKYLRVESIKTQAFSVVLFETKTRTSDSAMRSRLDR